VTKCSPVVIAGAGIGGLALALALARKGIASTILERAAVFSEAGAGIQLGPNAVRVLRDLGVGDALAPAVACPQAITVLDGPSGRPLASLPLGGWIARRHGAPYWAARRADLQAALLAIVRASSLIEIVTAFQVERFEETGDQVCAWSKDRRMVRGHLLVGADGQWSTVRNQLWPSAALRFTGMTAARALLPEHAVPRPYKEPVTRLWLAPECHVVHYPVRGDTEIAVIVIANDAWGGRGWSATADREGVLDKVALFVPELREVLASARDWRKWAIYDHAPLERWSQGRATLLGDAAHPILPYLAQGGAMAIEDAETLAAELAAHRSDPAGALGRYENIRRQRVTRVQSASRINGRIYHLAGPLAAARNLVLRNLPGDRIMSRYDWLYGWKGDDGQSPVWRFGNAGPFLPWQGKGAP
jgi:salicylate hydroxylase